MNATREATQEEKAASDWIAENAHWCGYGNLAAGLLRFPWERERFPWVREEVQKTLELNRATLAEFEAKLPDHHFTQDARRAVEVGELLVRVLA